MKDEILYDLEHDGYINEEEYCMEAEKLLKSTNAIDWRKASDLYLRAAEACCDNELNNIYHGCSADAMYRYILNLDNKCSAEDFEHALKVFAKIPCLNRLENADSIRIKWQEIYHKYRELFHVPEISYINAKYLYDRFIDVHYQYAYDESPECRVNRYDVIEAFEAFECVLIPLSKDSKLFCEETVGKIYSLSEPFELLYALFTMNEFAHRMAWNEVFNFVFMDYIKQYYSFMNTAKCCDNNSKRAISSIVFDFYREYYAINKILLPIRRLLLEGLEKGYIVTTNDNDTTFLFKYIFANTDSEKRYLSAKEDKFSTNEWEQEVVEESKHEDLPKKVLPESVKVFLEKYNMQTIDEIHKLNLAELSIDILVLSERSLNCLRRAGILSINDLVKKTNEEMLHVRNLGHKSLDEVKKKLGGFGLQLRTTGEK